MAYSKARRLADLIRSDGTIDTTKILDATIAAADIANDAITADKIVDNIALAGNITTSGTLAPVGVLTANAGVVVDNITIDGTQIDLSSGSLTIDVAGDIILDADSDGRVFFFDGGTEYGNVGKSSNSLILKSAISDGDILFQGNDGGSTITALTLDMSNAGTASFNHDVNVAGDLAVTGAVAITGGISGNPTTTTQSASDNTTKIATTAYVTTALANLSDSAPSTLNTLNELAAALGDDANYATTTTAAIAAKAPLANPTFTGTITSPKFYNTGNTYIDSGNSEIHLQASGTTFGKFFTSGGDFYINHPTQDEDIIFSGNDGGSTITALTLDMSEAGYATFNNNVRAASFSVGAGPTSELLFLSGAGHNGHGTTNARSVASFNTTGQSAGVWFGGRTDETTGIIGTRTATGNLAFETYNSGWGERMRITYDGNVGIGIDVPSSRFHLKSASRGSVALRVTDSDTTSDILRTGSQADGDGYLQLRTVAGAGNVLFDASGVSYIMGGNVGIGTNNPAFKLVVAHNSRNGMEFVPNTDDAGTNIIQNYNRGTAAYTPLRIAGNSITLLSGTSAQHSTSIDTSGNVSIGGDVLIQKGTATTTVSELGFTNAFDTAFLRSKYYDPSATTETYLAFHTNKSGAANGTVAEHMRLKGNRLGINQTNPAASLHVYNPDGGNATDKAGMLSEAVMKLQPHISNSTNMLFAQVDNGSSMGIQVTNGSATADWDLSLSPFGGNVGVGLVAPASRLHIVSGATRLEGGTVRINKHDNNCGLFLHSDAQSSHYNWMITTQDTVNEGIEFIPSTAVGGTTFSSAAMSIVASTGQMRAKSLLLETAAPISFISNSSENTYMRSVIYAHQNNTGSNFNNGMHIEMGRISDSGTAEVRAFVVGARGGQSSFKVTERAAGVTQADGDYLVKMYDLNADGYIDLSTGQATPLVKTRITSYGTNYFTPAGTTATNQAMVSVGETLGAKAGVLNIRSTSSTAGGIRHRMSNGTQYLNIASTHTGSGSIPYWHIKTNAYYNNNLMFVARVHGYAYGNSGHIIDMQRSGYAYSGSSTGLVGSQFVNNGSYSSAALDAYYTSAGQLCFRAYAGASSYYTGWAFDIKMQSPTGYNFDFVVEAHHMNATSGNYYT